MLLDIDELQVQVSTEFGLRTVVRNATFTADVGEAVGMVGESGCGKSMTARAAMRLLPPRAVARGKLYFEGRNVLTMNSSELRTYRINDVAMIHQDPAAYINPVRTVGDFLTEQMRLCMKMPKREAIKRAIGLLSEVLITDPEEALRRYPHHLSGGMLQRVMIAAAVASSPRLLLADEPTTALDMTTQAEIMGILDRFRRQHGLALLFITHNLELAAAVCDRIVVMYAGSIIEDQPAQILRRFPLHP